MPQLAPNEIKVKIDSLSKILEEAKTNKATLSGRLQESMKRLKEDLKLPSVDAAKKEIAKLEQERQSIQKEMNEKFQSLQEAYEW
jgi:small-conductance mechanosensitive channel